MPRNLTSDFITEATAAHNRPIILFEGVFKTSTLRIWNGYGDLSWNTYTWLGNGWLQGIEQGEESIEVEAISMTINLSGIPSSVVSLVLGDQKQGGAGKLYIGYVDEDGVVIPDPYLWWQGGYSHCELTESADITTARLIYESKLVDMERPREGRWTHDAQQALFAGDKGFEYVVAASNWSGQWGGKKEKPKKDNKRQNGGNRGGQKKTNG